MKISINLATRPFADIGPTVKRLRIGMGVLAVLAIGLGFGLHALEKRAEDARARAHSLDGAIARINGERQGYENMMRQPDNAAVLTESEHLNKLFDEKSFSWTLAMEDLETVLPGGVQVTTLEPLRDEKTHQITLRLRVVGPRDKAVALVQNLEHSRHFVTPRIVGESAETNGTGAPGAVLEPVSESNRVTFELLADYDVASLGQPDVTEKKAEKPLEKHIEATKPKGTHTAGLPHQGPAFFGGPGMHRPNYTGVSHPPQPLPAGPQRSPRIPPAGPQLVPSRVPQQQGAQPASPPSGTTQKPHPGGPQ
jgi:type IV pilus assembly protein PilN